MLKDVTNNSADPAEFNFKKPATLKNPVVNTIENARKKTRPSPRPADAVLKKQALSGHRDAVKKDAGKSTKSGAGVSSGFFFVRAPASPPSETSTKYAALVSGPVDAKQFDMDLCRRNDFRPCIPDSHSPGGSVIAVRTPGGTKLPLIHDLGVIRVFSSQQKQVIREKVDPFLLKLDPAVVSPPDTARKTRVLLLKQDQAHPAPGRRKRGQNQTMHLRGVSVKEAGATKVARRAGIALANERFEWLHLICHRMLGELSQNKENLVAGTFHANTLMIPVEAHLPHLHGYFNRDVSIHVSAELIPKSHIAKTIHYVIRVEATETLPPEDIAFKFDALLGAAPSRRVKTLIDLYMKKLLEREQFAQLAVSLAMTKLSQQSDDLTDTVFSSGEEDENDYDCDYDDRIRCTLDFDNATPFL